MKKLLLLSIFTTFIFAKLSVVVSIPPQESVLKQISGDLVDITTVVKPGNSPHTYEPKPSQMVAISKANLYFAIGVEFENVWLPKFKAQNSSLEVVHSDSNITKLSMSEHGKKEDDPHIWLSPKNLKTIATNMANALIKADSNNSKVYKENLNKFLTKLDGLDKEVNKLLESVNPRAFLIFHPSWGYFAKDYNLKQIAVEIEGKEPSPKELVSILELAKRSKIKAIFVQPEFSQKSANIIAKELGIEVIRVSPMEQNVLENILNFAKNLNRVQGAK